MNSIDQNISGSTPENHAEVGANRPLLVDRRKFITLLGAGAASLVLPSCVADRPDEVSIEHETPMGPEDLRAVSDIGLNRISLLELSDTWAPIGERLGHDAPSSIFGTDVLEAIDDAEGGFDGSSGDASAADRVDPRVKSGVIASFNIMRSVYQHGTEDQGERDGMAGLLSRAMNEAYGFGEEDVEGVVKNEEDAKRFLRSKGPIELGVGLKTDDMVSVACHNAKKYEGIEQELEDAYADNIELYKAVLRVEELDGADPLSVAERLEVIDRLELRTTDPLWWIVNRAEYPRFSGIAFSSEGVTYLVEDPYDETAERGVSAIHEVSHLLEGFASVEHDSGRVVHHKSGASIAHASGGLGASSNEAWTEIRTQRIKNKSNDAFTEHGYTSRMNLWQNLLFDIGDNPTDDSGRLHTVSHWAGELIDPELMMDYYTADRTVVYNEDTGRDEYAFQAARRELVRTFDGIYGRGSFNMVHLFLDKSVRQDTVNGDKDRPLEREAIAALIDALHYDRAHTTEPVDYNTHGSLSTGSPWKADIHTDRTRSIGTTLYPRFNGVLRTYLEDGGVLLKGHPDAQAAKSANTIAEFPERAPAAVRDLEVAHEYIGVGVGKAIDSFREELGYAEGEEMQFTYDLVERLKGQFPNLIPVAIEDFLHAVGEEGDHETVALMSTYVNDLVVNEDICGGVVRSAEGAQDPRAIYHIGSGGHTASTKQAMQVLINKHNNSADQFEFDERMAIASLYGRDAAISQERGQELDMRQVNEKVFALSRRFGHIAQRVGMPSIAEIARTSSVVFDDTKSASYDDERRVIRVPVHSHFGAKESLVANTLLNRFFDESVTEENHTEYNPGGEIQDLTYKQWFAGIRLLAHRANDTTNGSRSQIPYWGGLVNSIVFDNPEGDQIYNPVVAKKVLPTDDILEWLLVRGDAAREKEIRDTIIEQVDAEYGGGFFEALSAAFEKATHDQRQKVETGETTSLEDPPYELLQKLEDDRKPENAGSDEVEIDIQSGFYHHSRQGEIVKTRYPRTYRKVLGILNDRTYL